MSVPSAGIPSLLGRGLLVALLVACCPACSGDRGQRAGGLGEPHPASPAAATAGDGAHWSAHWPSDRRRYNVALISLDTLRADHLGCFGYARQTSPNIDALARRSFLFTKAYSTSAKTVESHMSIFTSLFPSVHRTGSVGAPEDIRVLAPGIMTLAELLAREGYETVGLHGGGQVDGAFGFDRGFERYEQASDSHAQHREPGTKAVLTWLRERDSRRPFFLFYHTYFVHDPYVPSPPFARRFDATYAGPIIDDWKTLQDEVGTQDWGACSRLYWQKVDRADRGEVEHLIALYDGAIAEMDAHLGEMLAALDDLAPDTIIVLLSDHGEEFGEHGRFQHEQLYNEILHVPLVIRHPDRSEGVRVDREVSLIDLAPTVLSMLGLTPIEQFQGRSLLATAGGRGGALLSELPMTDLAATIGRDRKVLSVAGRLEFYDLAADPGEERDLNTAGLRLSQLSRAGPAAAGGFHQLAQELAAAVATNAEVAATIAGGEMPGVLSEETIEQLRALGYIE